MAACSTASFFAPVFNFAKASEDRAISLKEKVVESLLVELLLNLSLTENATYINPTLALTSTFTLHEKSSFRYWVVVSLFLLVEPLLDLLPLPFITIAKLVGLAWCLASEPISGSRILFDQVTPFYTLIKTISNVNCRSTLYGKRAERSLSCGRLKQVVPM